MSRRPPPRQPSRSSRPAPPPAGRRAPVRPAYGRRPPAGSSNQLPLLIGGGLAALVLILLIAVVLTSSNNNNNNSNNGSTGSTGGPTTVAATVNPSGPVAGSDAPRMSLETFKKLYDDPAQRPMIIDVRDAQTYAQGHITGAISFPEADVDTRVKEIPKDKLVVAYCQWPAENESARVAQKLHDTYGYSYDNLKVLLGGWTSWKNAGYPIESTAAPSGTTPGAGAPMIITTPAAPAAPQPKP